MTGWPDARDVMSEFPTDRGWDLAEFVHPDPDVRHKSLRALELRGWRRGFRSPRSSVFRPARHVSDGSTASDAGVVLGGVGAGRYRSDQLAQLSTNSPGSSSAGNVEDRGHRLAGMTLIASGPGGYVLGLEGSAVSVDACSSSLVALHGSGMRGRGTIWRWLAASPSAPTDGLRAEFSSIVG